MLKNGYKYMSKCTYFNDSITVTSHLHHNTTMSMLLCTEIKLAQRAGIDIGRGTYATEVIMAGTILTAGHPPPLVGFDWWKYSRGMQVRAVNEDDLAETIGGWSIDPSSKNGAGEFFHLNCADAKEDTRAGGRLVDRSYLNPNCAFAVDKGRLIVIATKGIANGEQLLLECYMKKA